MRGCTRESHRARSASKSAWADMPDSGSRRIRRGMKRRLNLAAGLLHEPAVLLLDEPSVGLDPASQSALFRILNDLREQGRSIMLTTQHLDEAEKWCDRVGILRQGRLVQVGRPADALHARDEKNTLLGVLSEIMPESTAGRLRRRLPDDVDLRIEGRQLRITARNGEQLGMSMASLAAEGIVLESFRSPPARIDPAAPAVTPVANMEVAA